MKPSLFCKALAAALVLVTTSALSATWYISPTGSDANPGTQASPLATIMAAQTKASSGDIVYIMAGTYNLPNAYNSIQDGVYAVVNLINKNGITYEAMPGTRPVFNFSAINPTGYRVAAFWVTATGVTFQGFDVTGVQENITTSNNQSIGMAAWGCTSCTWNEVNVHDADCVGFYLEQVSASNLWYRCDSYNNAGINSYSYGNADGFGCHPAAGGRGNVIRECRAWNNSDDGYDCINAAETVTFDHCWSYMEGNNGGNGNGFKVGGWGSQPQNQIPNPIPTHIVFNCLSVRNSSHGFYANHQPAGPGAPTGWTNNTSYNNSSADFDMLQRTPPDYTTNVDQTDSNDIAATNEVMHYNLAYVGTLTADYNLSGDMVSSNSWTESVTVGNADFQSTDYTQITSPRAADGSLPVITFMHLVPGDPLTGLGCFVVPSAPTNLTAVANNGQAALSWAASTGATGYNVYRSTNNGGPYTVVGSDVATTNFTDTSFTNGANYYYYVVTALNPGDESTNSAQISVVPFTGPLITTASASPDPVLPGQLVAISATVSAQANPIATVTVNVNALGGATNQTLVSDGAGHYTNSVTVSAASPLGVQTLTVNAVDNLGNIASPYQLLLTVGSVTDTWNGSGGDENWSDGANWVGGTAPGYGYSLDFAGLINLTPLMDSSYTIYNLTFDNTAGAFTIGTTSSTLTLTSGVTNNSANAQTLNVPVVLGVPVTVNAATADLTLGQTVNNGGNLLTITDSGHSTTVAGAISGAGGLTKNGAGTNTLSGVNTFGGNITINTGTLAIGGAGQLGGGSYSGTITNNGVLTFNSTAAQNFLNVVAGTGALTQNGSGPLTLSAANSLFGITTVNGGTLQLANSLALQNSTLNCNGGRVTFSGITAVTLGGLSGTQDLSLLNGASAAVALTVGGNNANTTFSGNLSGSDSLAVIGTGTLTLPNANFTGNVTVGTASVTGAAAGMLTINGGTFGSSSSTLSINADGQNNAFIMNGGMATFKTVNVATVGGETGAGMEITGGTANFSVTTTGGNPANLNGGNSSGPLTITGGTVNLGSAYIGRLSGLVINGSGAVVTATNLNVTSNAGPANHNAPVTLAAGSLTIGTSASTGAFVMGITSGDGTNLLTMSGGTLTYAGTDGLQLGSYTLVNISSGTANLSGITVDSATGGNGNSKLNVTGGTLYLGGTTSGVGLVVNSPSASDYAQFGTATVGAVANWSSIAPITLAGTTTFKAADASSVAHNISLGGALSGTGNLAKTGSGTLTLSGTNTYAGTTTISGGLLLVTNTAFSATGVGVVTVQSGGTLGGSGIVASAVTVNSGGALALGNPLGTLTVSNNLTLAAGSTNIFEVNHSPLTNSAVRMTGTLFEGGTLIVTNIGVAAFTNGDSFKLFNAANYSGAFASVVLPSLPAGLGWNTNALNTSGTLSVVVTAKPVIAAAAITGNGFAFVGTGGVANANFYLLGTTNLAVPLTNWTVLLTNQFDNNGNFNFTNSVGTNTQSFYLLQLQ